jgi:hypothetical protein
MEIEVIYNVDDVSAEYYLSGSLGVNTQTVPINAVLPFIAATMVVGTTYTLDYGTWTGNPTSFNVQVYRNGVLQGVASNTYTATSDDAGSILTFSVISINTAGSSGPSYTTGSIVSSIGHSLLKGKNADGSYLYLKGKNADGSYTYLSGSEILVNYEALTGLLPDASHVALIGLNQDGSSVGLIGRSI